MLIRRIVPLLLWTLATAPLGAQLLVQESFNYTVGANLTGQNGGTGFSGAWENGWNGSGGTIVAGLSFSDYPTSGAALRLHSATNAVPALNERPMSANFGAAPQTVWSSCLVSYSYTNGPGYFLTEMYTAGNNASANFRHGIRVNSSGTNYGVRYEGNPVTGGANSANTTYLLIGKYSGGTSTTVWSLSAANYNAIKAGGITEAELNATNSGKFVDTIATGEGNTLLSYLALSTMTLTSGTTVTATYDEVRLGLTLSDAVGGSPLPPGNWNLVYSEDFNSGTVSTTNPRTLTTGQNVWNVGMRYADAINGELQGYRPENVSVVDGNLRIKTEKRTVPMMDMYGYQWPTQNPDGQFKFASGAIQTYNRFQSTHGYYEARVKMPSGKGTWPAFWLLPDRVAYTNLWDRTVVGDYSTRGTTTTADDIIVPMGNEIDIFEYMDLWERPTGKSKSHSGYFWGYKTDVVDSAGDYTANYQLQNPDGEFHNYAVYWGPGKLIFYIDGREVLTYDDPVYIAGADCPHYLILNTAVHTNGWIGTPQTLAEIEADLTTPRYMEVDYVRVYSGSPSQPLTTVSFQSIAAEDGFVEESTETSSMGGTINTTATLRYGDQVGNRQIKAFVSFDTSSIPDTANIVSAKLLLKFNNYMGTNTYNLLGDCQVDIKGGTGFGGATALAAGDFQAAPDAAGVAVINGLSPRETGCLSPEGLAAINKTGKTQLRIAMDLEDNNNNVAEYVNCYSGENSAQYRPVLEIIYR